MGREQLCKLHGPVVQGVDNAIHRINDYPVDSIVCFVSTYPLDSDLSGWQCPNYSVLLLIWISFGYNVISFYINIHTLFFSFFLYLLFYFIFFFFLSLNFLFSFFPCFGMFQNVLECSMFRFYERPFRSLFKIVHLSFAKKKNPSEGYKQKKKGWYTSWIGINIFLSTAASEWPETDFRDGAKITF